MSAKTELALQSALMSTGLVQPVETKGRGGRVEILCRQVPGQERPWLRVVEGLLAALPSGELHICRRYVLKEGKLAFGWHLGFEMPTAKALQNAAELAVAVLARAKPELTSVVEDEAQAVVVPPQRSRAMAPGQHPPRAAPVARAPGAPARLEMPPPGRTEGIRVVRRAVDEETGSTIIEEEMPLPHVYRDLNKPRHKDGRGARMYSERRR